MTPPRPRAPPGFRDLLATPWSTRDALRGVWAAALAQPLGADLPHILRVYLPLLEGLRYEGASSAAFM